MSALGLVVNGAAWLNAHAVLGSLPAKGQEEMALQKANLLASVREIVLRAVALPRSDRPTNMDEPLKTMRRWRV